MRRLSQAQREDLALALVITIGASALPHWGVLVQLWFKLSPGLRRAYPFPWYADLALLLFGLLLALPTWRRSGLRIGELGRYRLRVLLVALLCIGTTAVVYPLLPTRPWANMPASMWVLSPLAQDLVFFGYLYGRLERAFPGYLHQRVPVDRGLCLVVAFFALWHAPNFLGSLPAGYVVFQLFYTSVLAVIPGLTRQWSGSLIPATFIHSAMNFIAWSTN